MAIYVNESRYLVRMATVAAEYASNAAWFGEQLGYRHGHCRAAEQAHAEFQGRLQDAITTTNAEAAEHAAKQLTGPELDEFKAAQMALKAGTK